MTPPRGHDVTRPRPAPGPYQSEPRPWPAAPVAALLEGLSVRQVMDRLNCGRQAWETARVLGLTDRQADHWALALGRMPSALWPDWYSYTGEEAA